MKTKKLLFGVLSALWIGFTPATLTSCNTSVDGGIKYELLDDKTGYAVTGHVERTITEINIPSVYNDKPVTSIGEGAFKEYSSLISVTIGNNVTSIGDGAFNGCSSLTNVTMPANAILDVVEQCHELKTVVITGEGHIPNEAFYDYSSLESVTIGNGITEIGTGAFALCSSLENVTMGNGITEIGTGAFALCSSLTNIDIPDSVTSIYDGAFSGCASLTAIEIPDSVTSIGDSAFSGCSSLEIVFYTGTKEEWNNISIADFNDALKNATIIYNYVDEN